MLDRIPDPGRIYISFQVQYILLPFIHQKLLVTSQTLLGYHSHRAVRVSTLKVLMNEKEHIGAGLIL
jgi:hypothetical protein